MMNRVGLIAAVADQAQLTQKDAKKAVEAVFSIISDSLTKGDKVRIIGFGTFEVRTARDAKAATRSLLITLLEEVTETTIGDYERQHIEIDVNKYGKVTIDLKNNTGRVVAHGDARCHPNDTFNIKTGVKIAAERMIEEFKKPLHLQNDDAYYYIGDYGPEPRICKDEFVDRLNDAMRNCFNNKAVALEYETRIRWRKKQILKIIEDYMAK